MPHHFFYMGLSFMLMHEMDAVRCREWRIFPGLSLLSDNLGFKFFMIAHIPLFILLFQALSQPENEKLIFGLSIFFVVHLVLHVLFLRHKNNEFKDWISWSIISAAAFCGILDLIFGG
jgi:hypothetical protein